MQVCSNSANATDIYNHPTGMPRARVALVIAHMLALQLMAHMRHPCLAQGVY